MWTKYWVNKIHINIFNLYNNHDRNFLNALFIHKTIQWDMYYYFILQMKEGMCRVFKYPPKSHNCTFSEMNLNPDVSYFRPSVHSSCATMSSSINFKHFFASFIKILLNWKKNIFKRCFFLDSGIFFVLFLPSFCNDVYFVPLAINH